MGIQNILQWMARPHLKKAIALTKFKRENNLSYTTDQVTASAQEVSKLYTTPLWQH